MAGDNHRGDSSGFGSHSDLSPQKKNVNFRPEPWIIRDFSLIWKACETLSQRRQGFMDHMGFTSTESDHNEPPAEETAEQYVKQASLANDLGDFLNANSITLKHQLCALYSQVCPNAVALVDAFNYTDYYLNSLQGRYEGNVCTQSCLKKLGLQLFQDPLNKLFKN